MEAAFRLVPEELIKGFVEQRGEVAITVAIGLVAQARGEVLHDFECVEPQRLNLYRLSYARGDDPIANLGVHPSELDSGFAGIKQAVLQDANVVASAAQVRINDLC